MQNVFRYLAALLLLIVVMTGAFQIGCREKDSLDPDQYDAARIEGRWVDMTGTLNPDWHYHFDRGLLTQSYQAFGGVLTELTYPYATRQDSIFIGGDATNAPRVWIVKFECEEIVKVRHVGAMINAVFWLERE